MYTFFVYRYTRFFCSAACSTSAHIAEIPYNWHKTEVLMGQYIYIETYVLYRSAAALQEAFRFLYSPPFYPYKDLTHLPHRDIFHDTWRLDKDN